MTIENLKHKHFITIINPSGQPVTVDIELSTKEYELVNRICVLFDDVADASEPVLVISKPVHDLKIIPKLDTNPIPLVKQPKHAADPNSDTEQEPEPV